MDPYELQADALDFDCNYWEFREEEKEHKTKKDNRRTPARSHDNAPTITMKGESNRYLSSAKTPATGSNAVPLGKDGCLLPEEREQRISKGLCIICGKPGHLAASCPKRKFNFKPGMKKSTATFSISRQEVEEEESSDSDSPN